MVFTYTKEEPAIITHESCTVHKWMLPAVGGEEPFTIEASRYGVRIYGLSPIIQPEEGEIKLPVISFAQPLMTKLNEACNQAWKEQKKHLKDEEARKLVLSQ